MKAELAELVDRLGGGRWRPLLRLLDDADVDGGTPEPDPAAVEPYRWLLTRVGDGVRLTQAGRLPPAVVEETMRALGWDTHWIGKMNRESQTYPVQELRELVVPFVETSGVTQPATRGWRGVQASGRGMHG